MSEKQRYIILNHQQIQDKIRRIAFQILEDTFGEREIIIAGILDKGYCFAERIKQALETIADIEVQLIKMQINKTGAVLDGSTDSPLEICNQKTIILVDDVLNSGKTLAYGFGMFLNIPVKKIRTVVLVNRSHRMFPITVDFSGLEITTTLKEHIHVVLDSYHDVVYLS